MSAKILCVDDDANILASYQRNLRKRFTLDTATGGDAALALMASQGPYAVIVADMRMPGMDGIQFLMQVRQQSPDSVRIMLTGNADQFTAMEAVNKGNVYQFLTKPCPPDMLAMALENGLRQHRLVTAERELLEKTLNGSIKMLTDILSMLDPALFSRGEKLRDQARKLSAVFHYAPVWELELAAMLSTVGFVTLPPAVTQKLRAGQNLSGPEQELLQHVPEIGSQLLSHIPRLEQVAQIVLYHQKNFDGSGFPHDSVVGPDIPLGARILRLLGDLVLLETQGVSCLRALEKMHGRAGCYDPALLEAVEVCVGGVSAATARQRRAVDLRDLHIGHVLSSNVETSDGIRIVCAGTRVSQTLLVKLHNFARLSGLAEPIYVEDEESVCR